MPPVVVLDACVLYPAAQRDLFMWLAAGGTIHAHWTNEIHDEWIRNVERDYGVDRPPRQNSCRSDMMLNLGAIRMNDGSVRRSIQEQSGGAIVAAGER